MRTWVSDTFPLNKLECQYFDICKEYEGGKCDYTSSCNLRQWFNTVIEPYISQESRIFQINLIRNEKRKWNQKKYTKEYVKDVIIYSTQKLSIGESVINAIKW